MESRFKIGNYQLKASLNMNIKNKAAIIILTAILPNIALAKPQQINTCAAKIIPIKTYDYSKHDSDNIWLEKKYKYQQKSSKLTYIGSIHINKPEPELFYKIRDDIAEIKPDFVYVENDDISWFDKLTSDQDYAMKNYHETRYAGFWAKKNGAKLKSLEPPQEELLKYLANKFGARKASTILYMRTAATIRDRFGAKNDEIEKYVTNEINKYNPIWAKTNAEDNVKSIDELKKAAKQYFPDIEYYEAPNGWFDPTSSSKQTGSKFANTIISAASDYRTEYMFKNISQDVLDGKNIVAVVGMTHLEVQEDAFDCLFKEVK